jgi:integrase
MSKVLTALTVEKLRPRSDRYEIPDAGQRGLYVVVFPTGVKSFICRYRFGHRKRKLTFGHLSLAAARKAAADALYEVHEGRDPALAKKIAKQKAANAAADTVEAICQEYLQREGGKLRSIDQRQVLLERLVYPVLGDCPIDAITRSQLTRLFDKIEDNSGARTADLALAYLRKVFNWHALRTDTFKSPIISGMGRYNGKEHERDRVLDDGELRAIWKATEQDKLFSPFVRFLLLTGCRRSEAAGLRWDEIHGDVWDLPAARNKTKVDLQRPLSGAALAIIESQPRIDDGPLVFSSNGHSILSFSLLKREIDKASGVTRWRLHDLRRTARTLLSRAGVNPDIAERCLGHTINGVRGVYDRHRYLLEMRSAFEALAALIERIANPPKGNVRQLRG